MKKSTKKDQKEKTLQETIEEKITKLNELVKMHQDLKKKEEQLVTEILRLDNNITGLKEALALKK